MVGERELRVSTLELFFDLVYVFAITQIATLLSGDLNPAGFGRAVLVLGLVWWAWSQYAWAVNAAGNEGTEVHTALLAAMAGSFVLAARGAWFGLPWGTSPRKAYVGKEAACTIRVATSRSPWPATSRA